VLVGALVKSFIAWCGRHRSPATVFFYRARLSKFSEKFHDREMGTLTSLEVDEHLAAAGAGMSDGTRRHDIVALEHLQKFALVGR
jgi:hypothetical protein